MKEKELRRSLAVFPMGSVMKLTDLTARQIRYYEDQGLIKPERSTGNRRLYSLNDMDLLLEIKDFINEGKLIADIKKQYEHRDESQFTEDKPLSDTEVRRILYDEFAKQSGFSTPSTAISDLNLL
ncbi:MerR family transcriptional regulator [Streptococcus pacificus]|uniref:MerR family transcriptional regulator n=1 Tax=Streptococcus pacificus TaxID=2740577 RepID=A0ABS0ZJK8_9STRE|nr:MerR family transcriptional regulator [Streptococcus pacificus]MBJ8326183.1 MerR family transcriptional regulator [Streptococcus pacificus]